MLRLPYGVSDLFQHWLDQYFPYKKNKILNRIRSIRKGKLNTAEYHERMKGEGIFAGQIKTLFTVACRKAGIEGNRIRLSHAAFRRPGDIQLKLL
jgi:DNA repair photolyase